MSTKPALLFLYTESALHAGTGASISAVDLPIQRERTTQYPIVQGSGIKGSVRSQSSATEDDIKVIFGPKDIKKDEEAFAGAISFGEARLVLFPVRSLFGVFAYVTSNMIIARLLRDSQRAGVIGEGTLSIPELAENQALTTTASRVTQNGMLVLEEYSFIAETAGQVDQLANWLAENALPQNPEYAYWREKLKNSLVILPEDVLRDFVVNSTEITTHVKLVAETKTVETGALWTQEALPVDTLMMCNTVAHDIRLNKEERQKLKKLSPALQAGDSGSVLNWLKDSANLAVRIQLGGDETTGQGFVALRWLSA